MFIQKDDIIKYTNDIVLLTIQFKDLSSDKYLKNSQIGVLDLEIYYDEDKDRLFTYARGFKVYRGETKNVL